MAQITAESVRSILMSGEYPDFFSTDHIYAFAQVPKRRFYPSMEILTKDDNSRFDRKRDERGLGFQVKIYIKRLGRMNDEIAQLELMEPVVEQLLREADLVDNRIILTTVGWKRTYTDDKGPNYVVSELTFRITELSLASSKFANDGYLLIKIPSSKIDNPPIPRKEEYRYQSVFDTEISDGYSNHKEDTVSNPEDGFAVPIHFTGTFSGTIITHLVITNQDIGETGDKINQLKGIRTNGEKPRGYFCYNDKGNTSAKNNIVEAITFEIDQVQRLYRHNDLVVYRVVGDIIKNGTITIDGDIPPSNGRVIIR